MPEVEWNAFSNSMRTRDVAGIFRAAALAGFCASATALHDDRAINPIPQPKPQQITCRPTRQIRKRNFHGRTQRRLWEQRQLAHHEHQ
jgi:hypothetical protein